MALGERCGRSTQAGDLSRFSAQDLLDVLFCQSRADRHGGGFAGTKPFTTSPTWFEAGQSRVGKTRATYRKRYCSSDGVHRRPKKDPREVKILDPACGSGHFLLYCFDLLLAIYEEAYTDPDLGPKMQQEYSTLEALRRDVPRLILAHNLHGIDIDLRAARSRPGPVAPLSACLSGDGAKRGSAQDHAVELRLCRADAGRRTDAQRVRRQLEPKLLGQLVEVVFDKMKLAGEAGSLLKIEEEIQDAVAEAKQQWLVGPVRFNGACSPPTSLSPAAEV